MSRERLTSNRSNLTDIPYSLVIRPPLVSDTHRACYSPIINIFICFPSATARVRRYSFQPAGHVPAGRPQSVSVDQQRSGNEHCPAELFDFHDRHRSAGDGDRPFRNGDRSDQRRNYPHPTDLHESRISAAPVVSPTSDWPRRARHATTVVFRHRLVVSYVL